MKKEIESKQKTKVDEMAPTAVSSMSLASNGDDFELNKYDPFDNNTIATWLVVFKKSDRHDGLDTDYIFTIYVEDENNFKLMQEHCTESLEEEISQIWKEETSSSLPRIARQLRKELSSKHKE